DFEDAAHLFQRICVAVAEAVAQLDDLPLAIGQRLQHLLDFVLEHLLGSGANGRFDGVVFDEVAEVAVLALAHRPIQGDGVPADFQHPASLLDADASRLGGFLNGRLAAISWSSFFETLRSLLIVSIMWTGMRIVRAWSAMARVIAWRIHQVA